MTPAKLETWVWVLMYGGLVLLIVGLWTRRSDGALGGPLIVAGGVAMGVGALLVWVRSRWPDERRPDGGGEGGR